MAKWTINSWNAMIDHTVQRIGLNGIWYEYVMPLHANDTKYYEDAIDVRSRKSPYSRYNNGKRPGEYQPVGDKRYFNYYQVKKMKDSDSIKEIIVGVK